ncbi:MAG: putative lipid II flippase FtsW [Oscillospiraceae bacterium]
MAIKNVAIPHKKEKKQKRKNIKINKSELGSIDITFLILVILIVAIGLIMLFSTSYPTAYYSKEGNSFYYINRQLIFAGLGIAAMLFVALFDYRILKNFAYIGMGVSYILLVMVLFTSKIKGVRRWITIAGVQFQPSEIVKFAVVLFFAFYISKHYNKMKTFQYGILPFAIVLGSVAGLMVLQPHLSGTVIICAIGAIMMFIGGTDLKWFFAGGLVAIAGIAVVIVVPTFASYALSRVEMWKDPWLDYLGDGYQTIQSLYAIGSGGFFGAGIGNSRQKYMYLPEPQNDFIFAIVAEELGFIGASIIIILFALLIWRGFVIAMRSRDRFGLLLGVGIISQVGIQVFLNICVATNSIPNTGISLPFFSYGGSSLLMLLAEMGVILSISRQANLEKD